LDGRQHAEWYACTPVIHAQEQGAHGSGLHGVHSFQQIDPIGPIEVKRRSDEGQIELRSCQVRERPERCARRGNRQYLVVLPEAAFERRLGRVAPMQIRIDDE
jgi:hypothetical protein